MSKYVDGIQFVTEECCNCGTPFAMTADFQRRRLNDRELFYCPRGHSQHYAGPNEAQKLKRQLEDKQRQLEAESGRAAAIANQRDQVVKAHKKMRERVKNGVCPCCNRTFQNFMEHMKTQHPEFSNGRQLRVLRDTFGLTQKALADEAGVPAVYVSLYERCRPTPGWVENSIETWVAEHAA